MSSSQGKLASYLENYKIVNSMFSNLIHEKIQLLARKGILPYEYLDLRETFGDIIDTK